MAFEKQKNKKMLNCLQVKQKPKEGEFCGLGQAGPRRRLPRGTAELSFRSPRRSTNIEEGESPPWGCLNMPFRVCVCRTNRGMLQSGEAALGA